MPIPCIARPAYGAYRPAALPRFGEPRIPKLPVNGVPTGEGMLKPSVLPPQDEFLAATAASDVNVVESIAPAAFDLPMKFWEAFHRFVPAEWVADPAAFGGWPTSQCTTKYGCPRSGFSDLGDLVCWSLCDPRSQRRDLGHPIILGDGQIWATRPADSQLRPSSGKRETRLVSAKTSG
jgi:hypothetical protein